MKSHVQHRDLRNRPALVRTGYLELYHRDGICRTAHNAQAATNTLLFVDNHIGATPPGFSSQVHGITLDHAREAFHANAVVGTNVYAAGAENTD